MNLSLKLIVTAWLLSALLTSTSEAGKFGGFGGKSMNNSFKSFSNRTFSPKHTSVPKVNNFNSMKHFSGNTSSVFKHSSTRFHPVQSLNTRSPLKNLTPMKKMSPIKNFTPVKGGGLHLGKSPVMNLKPGLTKRTHSPIIGGTGKVPGLVLQPRNPLPKGGLPLNPLPGGKKPPFNPFPGGKIPPLNPLPGGKKPPFNPFPGGKIPPLDPGIGNGKPPFNPFPGGKIPPLDPGIGNGNPPYNPQPPYCPPTCPPHYCPPGYWPRPICLPPINLYPPVYQPCVTTVCPSVVNQTVVADAPVQQAANEPVQPALQLMVGKPASLEAQGLGDVAGSVAIEVGGIGLPTQVRSWTDKMLVIDVPFVGLNAPTPATLHLFDSNGKPLASIPVELIVPVETIPAVSSK